MSQLIRILVINKDDVLFLLWWYLKSMISVAYVVKDFCWENKKEEESEIILSFQVEIRWIGSSLLEYSA